MASENPDRPAAATGGARIDFDEPIDRRGTECLKYDAYAARGHAADDLPMWVADMDERIPAPAIEALQRRVAHGVFGYSDPDESYYEAVLAWVERHQGWRPERSWLVKTPGVVFALAQAVRAFTEPGDAVLIQRPVYYPFTNVIRDNGRTVVCAPLAYDPGAGDERFRGGRYAVDLQAFERVVEQTSPRLFILCNPHNPVGRAWTPEELRGMGEVCLRHGVTVVSDEIHADFARPGFAHTSFASLGDEFARACVVCTSASKTFNIAGLQISNIFVPDPALRARFERACAQTGYDEVNALGFVATRACYEHGDDWLAQLKEHLERNLALFADTLAREAPELRLVRPESTYLLWVDCSALGLDDEGLRAFVERDARLWLDTGTMFGPEGAGFIRVNIACPRQTVEETCRRLVAATRAWRERQG